MQLCGRWIALVMAIAACSCFSCMRRAPEVEVTFEEEVEGIVESEEPAVEEIAAPETVEIELEPEPFIPQPPSQVYGYRVQVIAASSEETAVKLAEAARLRFSEKVYVDYEPPYYKVRVGDCITHEDAEALREKAVEMGYSDAFIVETQIFPGR